MSVDFDLLSSKYNFFECWLKPLEIWNWFKEILLLERTVIIGAEVPCLLSSLCLCCCIYHSHLVKFCSTVTTYSEQNLSFKTSSNAIKWLSGLSHWKDKDFFKDSCIAACQNIVLEISSVSNLTRGELLCCTNLLFSKYDFDTIVQTLSWLSINSKLCIVL